MNQPPKPRFPPPPLKHLQTRPVDLPKPEPWVPTLTPTAAEQRREEAKTRYIVRGIWVLAIAAAGLVPYLLGWWK